MNEDLLEIKKLLAWLPPGNGPHYKPVDDITVRRHTGELIAKIEELRAIVEDLLDAPYEIIGFTIADEPESACRFCHFALDQRNSHAPGCPVLRKDELLGR